MKIRYKCLILDHDDTAVRSTAEIHYPSFLETLRVLRPTIKPLSLEEYISYCFEPGFLGLSRDIMKFSAEEQEYEYQMWKQHTEENVPDFYPGFNELMLQYRQAGGIITVVSHSEREKILRDYRLKGSVVPDLIFGWEAEEHKRKPNCYPVQEILKTFNLCNTEVLLVDDLKPGIQMAQKCHIPCAAVGWAHNIPQVEEYMRNNADYYLPSVLSLQNLIFVL